MAKGKAIISFKGLRIKKGSTEAENVCVSLDANKITSVVLVDYSEKYPCQYCEQEHYEECDAAWDACEKIDDYRENWTSFIEIATEDCVFRWMIDCKWKWAISVFEKLKSRTSVDIDDFIRIKNEEESKRISESFLQSRIDRFKRCMRLREKCSKDCRAKQDDGSCYFGFKCENGIPKEQCYVETRKRGLESTKQFIKEHILQEEHK